MKIILSRKGFDSSSGGVASPIFQSGQICSLPIPDHSTDNQQLPRYQDLITGDVCVGSLVQELTRGRISADRTPHLDPDLDYNSVPRKAGWKPIFGQADAAERHLQKNDVGEGDVFLFFGWFRQVELIAGAYRYIRDAPDLHVIFGWLQIERRIPVGKDEEIPDWASDHAHCAREKHGNPDVIYTSTDKMHLPSISINRSGAGVFHRFDQRLCLTMPGQNRSVWQLPRWLCLEDGKQGLSYHRSAARWTLQEDCTRLRSVGRGQEFVLDCNEYPQAVGWLKGILDLIEE